MTGTAFSYEDVVRAHERLVGVVKMANFQTRRYVNEPRQQTISVRTGRHQQSPRTGAALSRRNERRLNDVMHRRVKVLNFAYHQGIVAAHFQRKNFLRVCGKLLMQVPPGLRTAGEKQSVNA